MAGRINIANVAPCKDTIFMRGFSARLTVDEIRNYFSRGGVRNSVEFFKEDGNQLFIALRFESRDIAKDIIDRYDNKDVLGDRVHMTFYKDLKRYGGGRHDDFRRPLNSRRDDYSYNNRYDRGGRDYGGGGWKDYSGTGRRLSGGRGWGGGGSYQQQMGSNRVGRYTRSTSHSRSPSGSRSNSRSSSSSDEARQSRRKRRQRSQSADQENKSPRRKHKHREAHIMSAERMSSAASNDEREHRSHHHVSKSRKLVESTTEDQSPSHDMRQVGLSESNTELEEGERKDGSSSGEGEEMRGQRSEKTQRKVMMNRDDDKLQEEDDVIAHNSGKPSKNKKQSKYHNDENSDVDDVSDNEIVAANKATRRKSKDEEEAMSRAGTESQSGRGDSLINADDIDGGGDLRGNAGGKRRKHQMAEANSDVSDQEASDQEFDTRKRKKGELNTERGVNRRGGQGDLPNGRGDGEKLSPQKMSLIRDKKDEIEKAYRQDCETFATVTKMLISKDAELEDKIQKSLSENLKDIGQRCIQELREFVERLKSDDNLI